MNEGPVKLTQDVMRVILEQVRLGNRLEAAAGAAGVSYSSVRRWKREGQKPKALWEYRRFAREIEKAEAHAERMLYGELRESASEAARDPDKPNPRWLLEILKRRFSEGWGDRLDLKVREEALDHVIARLREGLDPATFTRVLECLAGESGEEGADEDESLPSVH